MNYLPKSFDEQDHAKRLALVEAYPLANWIVPTAGQGVCINHVPFLLDTQRGARGTLIGHVARANSVWQDLQDPCVAVFNGPQSYISPSFYPSKARDGKAVPTWNYAVVHAHGHARAVHEPTAVLDIITRLSNHFEQSFEKPWQVSDAPADYIERMLGAIVGIEIEVTHWVGKFKTSQNQSAENRGGVVAGLQAQSGIPSAQAMARLVGKLPLQNA
jgi:transcriptional regulator